MAFWEHRITYKKDSILWLKNLVDWEESAVADWVSAGILYRSGKLICQQAWAAILSMTKVIGLEMVIDLLKAKLFSFAFDSKGQQVIIVPGGRRR